MSDFGFDPALSAFLRAQGVAEQSVYATARQKQDLAQRQLDRSMPEWQDRLRQATESTFNEAETRGVRQSGATNRNVSLARAAVQRQVNEARAGTNDTILMSNLDAANQVAGLRQQRAEAELAARTRVTEANARSVYGS